MKRIMNKKVAAIGLAAGLALGAAGAAFAYWTTSGSGSGSAQTGTLSAVTITGTETTPMVLDGAYTLSLEIDNSANTSPVSFSGKTLHIVHAYCTDGPNPTVDHGSWFTTGTITEATSVAASADVVGAATAPLSIPNLPTVDQTDCENSAVALTLSAS